MESTLHPAAVHQSVKEHMLSLGVPAIQADRVAVKAYQEIVKLRSAQQAMQRPPATPTPLSTPKKITRPKKPARKR